MEEKKTTSFQLVYDSFFDRVTSDMYMEQTEYDTLKNIQGILLNSLHWFKLPRFDIYDYTLPTKEESAELKAGFFNSALTAEEINIISVYMMVEWFTQQIATTDNTRQIYSGSDFKMTSQANHVAKLNTLRTQFLEEGKHLQDIYKRRKKDKNGRFVSSLGQIMETPDHGYKIL